MPGSTSFTLLNLLILFGFLGGVTYMGHVLSGSVKTRKDFFNAGGGLPWWAVSSSVIATVISSVTFVTVPAQVFRPDGNLFYIQILMGLMLAKVLTAVVVAEPYYRSTDCKTVFEYIGRRTTAKIGNFAMVMGLSLTSINTGIRLLTTALVLSVVTGFGLWLCTAIVVGFAILWSWIAGLKTVIWTDFLLFIIFTLGAVFTVYWTSNAVEMTFGEAFLLLDERGKTALFDFSVDPRTTYTIWAGIIGVTFGNFALAGTQATYQRVKACRSVRDAKLAFATSALLYVTPICMLLVGLALSVFYTEHPLPPEMTTLLVDEPDRIFPYFIATELPNGISGIFIAAIFAAGISTIDTHLTEVSDITISDIYEKYIKKGASEAHYLMASRITLVGWGIVYTFMAMGFSLLQGEGILNLTFRLPYYVSGIILATIFLARIGVGKFPAYVIGAAASLATVLLQQYFGVSFFFWPLVSGAVMFAIVYAMSRQEPEYSGIVQPMDEQSAPAMT
ncbi:MULTISPECIES: sodium:solute symporter family transporter [Hyphomonas]|uniref:sodium:solute symporter family transporter n=1 Tax=Hyphomonas TaxID=85 RepID=UPI000C5448BC|nr:MULTISPECIES: hypothetical protein [Hyphomonas]MBB38459.1 hypothetical protein [Hyphomonas sp.]|tara:strand:- start:1049 stop:2560 length:1512 start_codon:yes stop_codon:yes gene_type:complete